MSLHLPLQKDLVFLLTAKLLETPVLRFSEELIPLVCGSTPLRVSPRDLCGPSRTKQILQLRNATAYVFRHRFDFSYPAIGRLLGGRDHATIMHAVDSFARGYLPWREQQPLDLSLRVLPFSVALDESRVPLEKSSCYVWQYTDVTSPVGSRAQAAYRRLVAESPVGYAFLDREQTLCPSPSFGGIAYVCGPSPDSLLGYALCRDHSRSLVTPDSSVTSIEAFDFFVSASFLADARFLFGYLQSLGPSLEMVASNSFQQHVLTAAGFTRLIAQSPHEFLPLFSWPQKPL